MDTYSDTYLEWFLPHFDTCSPSLSVSVEHTGILSEFGTECGDYINMIGVDPFRVFRGCDFLYGLTSSPA